jgi:egghead protein (zeste-white 4 protein)
MDRGRRSRWIEGYVEEQPAQSLVDFMKQRRRWFLGLLKVVRHAPVRLRWRIPLAISVGLWSLSWVGVLYTYVRLFAGVETPGVWIVWIGNLAFAIYVVNYVIGLKLNLDDWEPIGKPRAAALYAAQVLLIPVFSLLEVASVIWALLRRDPGFHVIKK